MLRRSDLVKTALLRAVSHDLRSPLTGIRTAVGALRAPGLNLSSSDRDDLLETIELESSRLTPAGRRPARPLAARSGGCLARARGVGPDGSRPPDGGHARTVASRSRWSGETPVVEVDGSQVQRAIANLIENALKFSPPGAPVHVRITATRKEAIVRVVDQGPGLDAGRARARVRSVLPARRGSAVGRRPRARDRARFRRGERRPRVGGVAARAGSDVRPRAARRRGAGRSRSDERTADPRRRRRAADPARPRDDAARCRLRGGRGRDRPKPP